MIKIDLVECKQFPIIMTRNGKVTYWTAKASKELEDKLRKANNELMNKIVNKKSVINKINK